MLDQRQRLFTAPPEHEGVAAFQAQDTLADVGQLHQPERYVALLRRWFATALARKFECLRPGRRTTGNPR